MKPLTDSEQAQLRKILNVPAYPVSTWTLPEQISALETVLLRMSASGSQRVGTVTTAPGNSSSKNISTATEPTGLARVVAALGKQANK